MGALNQMLNTSSKFISKAKNSTSIVDGLFTQEELDALEKKMEEVK